MAIDQTNPVIRVRDLCVTRHDTPILRGVSCDIQPGVATAILGPNGCGKTTFTRTLTGQSFITSGHVEVLGQTIGQTDVRALRRRVGIVNPTLDETGSGGGATVDGELSAIDAVCTGYFATVGLYDRPTADQRDRAAMLLDQVGLSHRIDHRIDTLSTGERRRCLIARALVHLPELLILDEPTAGLDIAGREQVLATIHLILQNPTPPAVLFITHHVEELPPNTDQVLLMRDGQFIAAGTPDQVITPESLTQTFDCKVYVKKVRGRFWLEVLPEAWLDLLR